MTAEYVTRMRDAMAHRGPDGAGTWVDAQGKIGLGHRRLAILDLSAAAGQPMSNGDGSLWISFNGEIYNHAEIRAELKQLGYREWTTDHADTEMILHAFEQWGIECLQRFRGMFAFALWDARRRELWLVRDRLGIKPLYYSVDERRLAFASDITALLQDAEISHEVDREAMYHYLSFLAAPAPLTLFQAVRKLPAATWLRVGMNGDMHECRYWDIWEHVEPLTNVNEQEIAARLLDELRTAVRLRRISDVPVGVFLSGGIDSSTNAALFAEGNGRAVQTFCIGYCDEYGSAANEFQHARNMAARIGAEHHERRLTEADLEKFLPIMTELQGEPVGDPVCVPLYYVSKLAREQGVTVCQLGEGADELFCGYPSWMKLLRAAHWNELPGAAAARAIAASALRLGGADAGFAGELLRRAQAAQPLFWSGYEAFTEAQKQRLISADVRHELRGLTSWEPLREARQRFEEKAWERTPLQWMTYADLNLRLPELLLMRVDKMSMAVSLEARVPFLDHRFVEFAMSIPSAVKVRRGVLKYILKRAVRGLIPDDVIDRRKQGFGAPVHQWLLGTVGERVRRELREFCAASDLLDGAAVEDLVTSVARGRAPAKQLWFLLNLVLWWKRFIAGTPADREPLLAAAAKA